MKCFLQDFMRWSISGSTGIFIAKTLYDRWLEVQTFVFNHLWQRWRGQRGKKKSDATLTQYPFWILMGTLGFMGLRSIAFLLVVLAFTPLNWEIYKPLMSGFGFAWLLSLVIPAPGGLGVFEASALQVLDPYLSPAILLGAVCVYRLVTLCAEMTSAIASYLVQEESLTLS
jgi:glycosyltransferase 2 family protein